MANKPGAGAVVWRYMPYNRFIDLVTTRELYLCRLDYLEAEDPHEGRWLDGVEGLRFIDGVEDSASLIAALEQERMRTYVNCWTLRLREHLDMWNRYEPAEQPVAVATTYEDLISALADTPHDLAIGGVCYLDTLAEFVDRFYRVNTLNLAFCKRPEFRWEQEVRIVYQDHGPVRSDCGTRVPVNLERLNATVWLPLGCGNEVHDSITGLLRENHLEFEIRSSSL